MWGGGEEKTASLARETARLAANGAMPDVSPAAGTPAETGAAAAPAVAAPGTGSAGERARDGSAARGAIPYGAAGGYRTLRSPPYL